MADPQDKDAPANEEGANPPGPSSLKRKADEFEDNIEDDPIRKEDRRPAGPQSTRQPQGRWINASFPVANASPMARGNAQSVVRAPQWIQPSFPTSTKPSIPSISGRSRPMQPLSTPARPLGAVQRPLQALKDSTERSTPRRAAGPLAFSMPSQAPKEEARHTPIRITGPSLFTLPSTTVKEEERPQTPLSSMTLPFPSNKGKLATPIQPTELRRFKTLTTTKLALASTPRGEDDDRPPHSLGIQSSDDDVHVDEVDRGLGISPEKLAFGKGKGLIKNGLAERASHLIARSRTDHSLWQQSITSSRSSPDLKLRVLAVLAALPGRTLTRCQILDDSSAGDEDGGLEGTVLFGPGTRELQPGMVLGAWRPWGELGISKETDVPTSAVPSLTSQSSSPVQQLPSSSPTAKFEASQRVADAANSNAAEAEQDRSSASVSTARSLLVTRFVILR